MIDLTGVTHHPAISDIVDVVCSKTRTKDRSFFNTAAAYFLGKMASSMRVRIKTMDRGIVPVNIYGVALADSGFGKGTSMNIIENEFLHGFTERFMIDTLPAMADKNLWRIANERALRDNTDPQVERDAMEVVYKREGNYLFTFDEATPAAIDQLRNKLLLSECGAMNLQVDEIGLNLSAAAPALAVLLELYDRGYLKPKLVKNTKENTRTEDLRGQTPANCLLFGVPSKVFDGGDTEDQFYSLLETGYARRCFFGLGHVGKESSGLTAEEIFELAIAPNNDAAIAHWSAIFHDLADPAMFGWTSEVPRDVSIRLIEYQQACIKASIEIKDTNEIKAAEIAHRYDKALKLAGAFAFVDRSIEVEMDHLMQAILMVEESGKAFEKILTRERPYERLAKFIAGSGAELTQPDLMASLPFYKGRPQDKATMMSHAVAWGYKNNIIIKKAYGANNIEFFSGEMLKATNLDEILVSYSDHYAYNYAQERVPFTELHQMTQAPDMNWANHAFQHDHRSEDNVIPGFNMIVIDVDGGISLDVVHELLREIKFMTYTTKRHRVPVFDESGNEEVGVDRFRLMIPTNYELKLDRDEYKEMITDIIAWLPFEASADVDVSSNQRSKKWLTNEKGSYHINEEGALFNILPFIPKTSQNEVFKKEMKEVASMDNLERWFAGRMVQGDRNNTLLKYALILVDSGLDLASVDQMVHGLNSKIPNPMDADRIAQTIMVTAAKRIQSRSLKLAA
ncbi:primase C-terminal domain-containing protein [Roseococcus sp.]|uniref:primase C-terminal domain-containing protein n=1 Tax=Roseococcus sp. TaxID=2109646 RepID=UPI003BAC9BBD